MHSRLILALGLFSGALLAACATQQPQPGAEAPSVAHTAKPLSDGTIELFVSKTSPNLKRVSQFSMTFDDALATAAGEECPNGYTWPQQPQDAPKTEIRGQYVVATLRRIVRCK